MVNLYLLDTEQLIKHLRTETLTDRELVLYDHIQELYESYNTIEQELDYYDIDLEKSVKEQIDEIISYEKEPLEMRILELELEINKE